MTKVAIFNTIMSEMIHRYAILFEELNLLLHIREEGRHSSNSLCI